MSLSIRIRFVATRAASKALWRIWARSKAISLAFEFKSPLCVTHSELYNFWWWKTSNIFFSCVSSIFNVPVISCVHAASLFRHTTLAVFKRFVNQLRYFRAFSQLAVIYVKGTIQVIRSHSLIYLVYF